MSYTKLDSSGNALPDSAAAWSMVKDNVTGLTWEMKDTHDNKPDYSNPNDPDNEYTWYDSNPATNGGNAGTPGDDTDTEDFLKKLNDSSFGGHNDWRLPNIKELTSIVNFSSSGQTMDTKYFPDPACMYWSSTTEPDMESHAYIFDFCNGGDMLVSSKSSPQMVRAVCGGHSGADDTLTDNGDGTVTDTSTGLMWEQDGSHFKTWEQALVYCEGSELGHYTDWRLPTIKELLSIVDYRYDPTINPKFLNTRNRYWSSTTYTNGTQNAFGVDFIYGAIDSSNTTKNSSWYVRAVRGGQTGLTNGLVASYPFNGNANDVSGNGYNGKVNGATLTADRFGNANSAYSFDGNSDIDLTGTNSLNFQTGGFSLVAWAKFSTGNYDSKSDNALVGKHYCGYGNGYFLSVYMNSFSFYSYSQSRLLTTEKYNDGNWHFLVGVFDGTTQFLYIDGVLNLSKSCGYPTSNSENIKIGVVSCSLSHFEGSIDDVRIYNRPLSEDEVKQLFTEQPGSILSATPDSRNVASASGTTTFNISNTGTGTMPWTATVTSGSSWLSITSGSSGSNTGTTTCAFTANTSATTRTGTIRITAAGATGSPKDVTVTQAGASTNQAKQFLGVWSDGVWIWDKPTNKWTLMASTASASKIAAGKVDTDSVDDLIGVWASGFYIRQSSNGQWLKLSATLPTWIAAGDLNNDGRDDVIGTWTGDGVYYRNSATGNWMKLSSPAKQLTSGNIGGTRDDLVGVWTDGLWVRYSADSSWKKIDAGIPLWITAGDMTGDNRADIVGSYSTGTWYRNSVNGAWTKVTTPAEQLAAGDIDGDGRDDLVGIWSDAVWVKYGATGQWQKITPSKPKWITTGRMAAAIQAAGSLDDPMVSGEEVIDLSKQGPDEIDADTADSVQQ